MAALLVKKRLLRRTRQAAQEILEHVVLDVVDAIADEVEQLGPTQAFAKPLTCSRRNAVGNLALLLAA